MLSQWLFLLSWVLKVLNTQMLFQCATWQSTGVKKKKKHLVYETRRHHSKNRQYFELWWVTVRAFNSLLQDQRRIFSLPQLYTPEIWYYIVITFTWQHMLYNCCLSPFFQGAQEKFLDLWCIPFSNKRKISKEEDNRTSDDTFLNHRLANLGSKRGKYLLSCFLIYLIHCVHPYCPPML